MTDEKNQEVEQTSELGKKIKAYDSLVEGAHKKLKAIKEDILAYHKEQGIEAVQAYTDDLTKQIFSLGMIESLLNRVEKLEKGKK